MIYNSTILALAHAGGSAFNFHPLRRWIPRDIQFVPADLPGHGMRIDEPLLDSIPAMAHDIATVYQSTMRGRYTLFGHSMGATLAYQICCDLAVSGGPMPEALVVSGRQAPTIGESERLSDLSRPEFVARLRALGGIPDDIANDPEFVGIFEPIIRADFKAVEDYSPSVLAPLTLPVIVLAGEDDGITEAELAAWSEITTGPVDVHMFRGGHFYLFERPREVADTLAEITRGSARRASGAALIRQPQEDAA